MAKLVLPKPDPKAIAPSETDWAQWCEHPITRWVAAAWQKSAEKQKQAWLRESWSFQEPSHLALATYRARADAYMAFLQTGLENYESALKD